MDFGEKHLENDVKIPQKPYILSRKEILLKRKISSNRIIETGEKFIRNNLKFSWKKLGLNMEMLSLQEALKKIAMKEDPEQFFIFLMSFDHLNANSLSFPPFPLQIQGFLDEIDKNI